MERNIVQDVLQAGLDGGADFTEIYVEETRSSSLSFRDEKAESASTGVSYGVGVRLLFGTEMLYAHTSKDDRESLLSLTQELARSRSNGNGARLQAQALEEKNIQDIHPVRKDPRSQALADKLELLRRTDGVARAFSPRVRQVSVSAADSVRNVLIANSEGLWVQDRRIRSRFMINVTAEDGDLRFSAGESPGSLSGSEFFESLDYEILARKAAERAVRMLTAGYIEGRKMPVVLGNGFGGVIFHEACGHPLETEAIRKDASPFAGKMGEKIAHEAVTAIDDGTIAGSWGSLNIDDEGRPTERTTLIENGILKSYLSDRIGSLETGSPLTGSARRESYKYAPVSRMRNTFIASGSDSADDMIASVDYGLYSRKMGGGSVNPATGEFNFSVEEGYIIKDGKVTEPVRGATLIGKGHEILPLISMVGDDLELAAGMCGASSGMVPVTVGQPTIKVDEILVGGKG